MNTSCVNVLESHGLSSMDREQQIEEVRAKIDHLEDTERQFTPDNQDMPHPVIDELNLVLSELLSAKSTKH